MNSPSLALECSSSCCAWALQEGPHTLARGSTTGRASGAFFASLAASWPREIRPARILVGVGPGSFSGIRATIAAALGMSRAWSCPVLPVRSTHALARQHPTEPLLGIFSDAKRGQCFYTAYSHGIMTVPSRLIPHGEREAHRSRCSLALALGPLEGFTNVAFPDPAELALAWQHTPPDLPPLPLEPIYLHDSVVPSPQRCQAPCSQ